jgi:hypothetical protein
MLGWNQPEIGHQLARIGEVREIVVRRRGPANRSGGGITDYTPLADPMLRVMLATSISPIRAVKI